MSNHQENLKDTKSAASPMAEGGGEMQSAMAPPAFQLKASTASNGGDGNPVQRKEGGVIQRQPTSRQAGTIQDFVQVFNTTSSAMGTLTGMAAHNAMLRLGETEMSWTGPLPKTTPYFNTRPARYVYTTTGGWIDLPHFLFHAGRAYMYKMQKLEAIQTLAEIEALPWYQRMWIPAETISHLYATSAMSPEGESVQEGILTERAQQLLTPRSAFSYEDLPSDSAGARFAVQHFNSNLRTTFGQQLEAYFTNVLGATEPRNAPNFNDLPADDTDEVGRQNTTTTPVFTQANP